MGRDTFSGELEKSISMKKFTIGKVAKAAGVSVETVRFYEKKGLVRQPDSNDGTYRIYPHSVVVRIKFIQRSRDLGFSLEETSELLLIGDSHALQTRQLRAQAESKIAAVSAKISDLQRLRSALEQWLENSEPNSIVKDQMIVESLSRNSEVEP